ncbi:hypothetical protein QQZ08_008560 [Neonectria magnoliae]|uniref:Uncharacterized protein n=1 Tax=Neonectria magnoliae TaxID=2732573 RepID=A0ABR1HUI2_9HYPO
MEESAPKRRRTSPRTSLGIHAASTTPPSADEESTTAQRKRPSFASPTKASLARHNPEVLERRRSASPQKSPEARSFVQHLEDEPAEQSPSELLALRLANSVLESDAGKTDDAVPKPDTGKSIRRAGGSMASAARRTPKRPNPRPLPPPGSDEVNPFVGKVLRRSPPPDAPGLPAASIPQPEPESEIPEPELPPSVPDVISSTPPRGIHSSPLRWREKSNPKPSSPLKQPAARMPEKPNFPTKTVRQPQLERADARTTVPDAESTTNPRKTRAFDPNATKKEERKALQKEIEQLRKDLEIAQKENERIRVMQQSGRVLAPADPDAIVNLMRRQHTESDSLSQLTASQKLVKMALNPIGLLPFGKQPQPPPPVSAAPINEDEDLNIKSHHPVLMTAEEELPYLELFSPFSLTSNISALPQEPNQPSRQMHSITLRSRESPGLFTARIEMTVNAMDLTILDLRVAALEPAAKAELGSFIDKICNGECNRTMQRNVGILSWAMGEWIRVAVERAAFWCQLEKRLGSKGAVLEAAEKMRARKSRRRKDDEEDEEPSEDREALQKADLIRYLGQQWYEVSIPHDDMLGSAMRFEWKTGFDWTGEAQSKLSVMIGVPGKWHQMDERGALCRIPKLFAELVNGGENPETAVQTIVVLVTGDTA